jgi:hypothetical protein
LLPFAVAAAVLTGTGTAPVPAAAPTPQPLSTPNRCANDPRQPAQAVPAQLRLPDDLPPGEPPQVAALELNMLAYLSGKGGVTGIVDPFPYRRLGWCVDKYVRDTGPWINNQPYGTHKAVRIYYSPEVMAWMLGGRHGAPADGAVIIKEQYPPPAARYGHSDADLDKLAPNDWVLMIRNSKASHDGWWWAELYGGMKPGGTSYPNAGYGLYCLRCHSSAQKALTFSSERNIKSFPGDPISFFVDDSWRTPAPAAVAGTAQLLAAHLPAPVDHSHPHPLSVKATPQPVQVAIQTFPPEPYDQMLPRPTHMPRAHFLTSDQCMGCHSAGSAPIAGPVMWLTPPPAWAPSPSPAPTATPPYGVNVSPYGEWRWSPMGLAGRDPVFFSQLESELQYLDGVPLSKFAGPDPHVTQATVKAQVVDTCMRCHGVMGKRSNELDNGPQAHFDRNWIFATWPSPIPGHTPSPAQTVAEQQFHYGGLARDGISCTVCHQIRQTKAEDKSLALVLDKKATGLFDAERQFTQIHGPFDKPIAAHPMKEALDIKPVFSQITTSSRLCASCHSIDLPVVDDTGKTGKIGLISGMMPLPNPHDVEQNTYVEWVNSSFQTEYPVPPNPAHPPRSCQSCHMPSSVTNDRLGVTDNLLQTRIAIAQDQTYPEADHLAPLSDITVTYRKKGFARHELLGLNAFLLRTFQQNGEALGVRIPDYMSGSYNDLDDAIGNVVRQAQTKTATIAVSAPVVSPSAAPSGVLTTNVTVTNLTGHRFPSGVGFRRAFVELDVTDAAGAVLWASGMTNGGGEIVTGPTPASPVLPTEMLPRNLYQHHHDEAHPITASTQVQIFEELVTNADGDFTESFIRRDHIVKDNRLLPYGWKFDGPSGIKLPQRWLEASRPRGFVRRVRPASRDRLRPHLQRRQRPRRRGIQHPAERDRKTAGCLAAARESHALVSVVGTEISARPHHAARPGRHALECARQEPAAGEHADEELEAPDRDRVLDALGLRPQTVASP